LRERWKIAEGVQVRLLERFRARDSIGREHTITCYQDSYERPTGVPGQLETVDTVRVYQLNGGEEVQRVDDDTFLTEDGSVLRRVR
jgi:hypothetical protein